MSRLGSYRLAIGGDRVRAATELVLAKSEARPCSFFFFQAEDGIRDLTVTGVQTCALPICGADVIVAPFNDPIGRDAIVQWPGGVNMQLYWHTTAPNYAKLQTVPENRVYVSDRKSVV